ncbi:hypothetical protein ZHAS_00019029 [Anopheles sinensis]|uniref:Uncharacterized protein n=1 Tax=Anopheles sinensis TaxID=74873 RepID=A0A084WL91_ANOSI|nr:hypothetical protein ZHAS_00019029 [Anopheles sinensis]
MFPIRWAALHRIRVPRGLPKGSLLLLMPPPPPPPTVKGGGGGEEGANSSETLFGSFFSSAVRALRLHLRARCFGGKMKIVR